RRARARPAPSPPPGRRRPRRSRSRRASAPAPPEAPRGAHLAPPLPVTLQLGSALGDPVVVRDPPADGRAGQLARLRVEDAVLAVGQKCDRADQDARHEAQLAALLGVALVGGRRLLELVEDLDLLLEREAREGRGE